MSSKKFGGLDIAELDKATELESKSLQPDPVDSRFSEWVEPVSAEKKRTIHNLQDIDEFMKDSEPGMTAANGPAPKNDPISKPASEPDPIIKPSPIPRTEPIPRPQPVPDPVPVPEPEPIPDLPQPESKKTISGPGLLDSIPLLGNLIRAVQNRRFGFLAWVIFNLMTLGIIFEMILDQNGFWIGALVYLVGAFIVTTPIGELIIVLQNGWKPLKPEQQQNRIEAILDTVYFQSKEQTSWLKKKPRLYFDGAEYPNAYAFGRGSLCVTKGLLEYCTDDEIHGILAHEMGHLAYRHSDENMIVHVGNLFISLVFVIIGIICNAILALVSNILDNSRFFDAIGKGLNYFFSSVMVRAWYGLGNLFTHASSIQEEYDADAYAVDLGYSRQLCDALATIDNGSESESGTWASLMGDHPDIPDRIMRMQGK